MNQCISCSFPKLILSRLLSMMLTVHVLSTKGVTVQLGIDDPRPCIGRQSTLPRPSYTRLVSVTRKELEQLTGLLLPGPPESL